MADMMDSVKYYSSTEVAEMLGVSTATIYRLTRSGKMPSLKLTRSVRISAKALDRWLKNQQRAAQ
jgi:excisionase family DNA binding protein